MIRLKQLKGYTFFTLPVSVMLEISILFMLPILGNKFCNSSLENLFCHLSFGFCLSKSFTLDKYGYLFCHTSWLFSVIPPELL